MVWREGSRSARAARTATVLPAPTSPVTTPRARWLMHQPIRATASAWAVCRCSICGASPAEGRLGEAVVGLQSVTRHRCLRRPGAASLSSRAGRVGRGVPSGAGMRRGPSAVVRTASGGQLGGVLVFAQVQVVDAGRCRRGWGRSSGRALGCTCRPIRCGTAWPIERPRDAPRWGSGRTGRRPARPGARPGRRRPRTRCRATRRSRSW